MKIFFCAALPKGHIDLDVKNALTTAFNRAKNGIEFQYLLEPVLLLTNSPAGLKLFGPDYISPDFLRLEGKEGPRELSPTEFLYEAMYEGLLTVEQVVALDQHLFPVCTRNGLIALSEGLITVEQMIAFPNEVYTRALLSTNGLIALREGLITPEKAALLPFTKYTAQEEQMIMNTSPEFGTNIKVHRLECLMTDTGLECLRKELFTVEQIARLADDESVRILLSETLGIISDPSLHEMLPLRNKQYSNANKYQMTMLAAPSAAPSDTSEELSSGKSKGPGSN